MEKRISFYRYLFIAVIGFGLAGLFWGLILYLGIPGVEFPFHHQAIIIVGLLGGISLAWIFRSIKKIVFSVVSLWVGLGLGFVFVGIFAYYLYLYSVFFLSFIPINVETLKPLINLETNIGIGSLWLAFLCIGAIVGLFCSLFLKTRKWPLMWRGGIGMALGSLIGPIIGNLAGNWFNSLLLAYLITFFIISVSLGKFLAWGVYREV